jgi:hypothetical protein
MTWQFSTAEPVLYMSVLPFEDPTYHTFIHLLKVLGIFKTQEKLFTVSRMVCIHLGFIPKIILLPVFLRFLQASEVPATSV